MKRNKSNQNIPCPNGCGRTFKLNFKRRPKGMAQHLESCGTISTLPKELKDVLKTIKKRIGV